MALGALAAGSVALALAAGELVLRAIGFSYPALHAPDELAGLRLIPGAEGWYREEGEAHVRINADGWRDRERAKPKPANTVRIAVLGDSFTEAIQVPLEASFTARLETALNACRAYGSRVVEVLNFGVSGFGTAQQLLTLRHRVPQYGPDVVLLAFLPSNDVRNNSSSLEGWKARPFYRLQEGKLVLDAAFRADPGFLAKQRFAEGRFADVQRLRLHQLYRRVRDGGYHAWSNAPAAAALAKGGKATLAEAGTTERVFLAPTDPKWAEAWSITEALLGAVHEESRTLGARFVVTVLTSGAAVHPDADLRRRYAQALGVPDFLYPDRRIGRLGEKRGFEVISLGVPMQRRAEASGTYFHGFPNTRLGFGHWNAEGHAAAAELVAERFCADSTDSRPGSTG